MALAILELPAIDQNTVRFTIDTGTNRYYQLKIGRNLQQKSGIDWLDEVYFVTPMRVNDAGGSLWNSSKQVSIPTRHFDQGKVYVQLSSFKTPQGRSPALSRVIRVPIGLTIPDEPLPELTASLPRLTAMNSIASFAPPRRIPCQSGSEAYAQQASLEDLFASLVRVAGPIVLNLLSGTDAAASGLPSGTSGGSATGNGNSAVPALLTLLNTLLSSVGGTAGNPVAVSHSQSLLEPINRGNRFLEGQTTQFAQPFFWQALVGAIAGPLIQALPQLLNAANQKRIQMKQADNKLVTDVLSEVNRRILLEQLLQAQHQGTTNGQANNGQADNTADLNQLIQLLQQVPSGQSPTPAPATLPSAATPQSLSIDSGDTSALPSALSSKVVVSFVMADPVSWHGTPKVLFAKQQGVQLKIRLNVAEPAPKTPLPKAIIKIVFKDSANQSIYYEKIFKKKDVLPNNVLICPFSIGELSHLPVNQPIALFAEFRWLTVKTNREYRAVGSGEMILVNQYFLLKEQGQEVSPEQELTDMQQFRPFWNKVWESPLLDAATTQQNDRKKYNWELNVNAKYSVLLSADQAANGLMETKILRGAVNEESLSEKVEGRMKAGLELSIAELNKLMPLWKGESALAPDKLAAFQTQLFAQSNAREFIRNLQLKGRARERGMIWVIPIFKLFNFILGAIQKTDETGQVVAIAEEPVRFPLPISARVIGLKSQ
jgi:hypothetical protein